MRVKTPYLSIGIAVLGLAGLIMAPQAVGSVAGGSDNAQMSDKTGISDSLVHEKWFFRGFSLASHAEIAHIDSLYFRLFPSDPHGGSEEVTTLGWPVFGGGPLQTFASEHVGESDMRLQGLLKGLFASPAKLSLSKRRGLASRQELDGLEARLLMAATTTSMQYVTFAVDIATPGAYCVDIYQSVQQFKAKSITNLTLDTIDATIPVVVHEANRTVMATNWTLATYFTQNLAAGRNLIRINKASFSSMAATTGTLAVVPAAPTGLALTVQSSTAMQLKWTDGSNNETGFVVERQTGTGSWMTVATVAAGTTNYADSGLAAGTTYSYRVSAKNGAGTSTPTTLATATTEAGLVTVPMAPSNLILTTNSASSIGLAWTDNSTNETGFVVQRQTGTSGIWTTLTTTTAGATTFTDTTVLPNTEYSYQVLATNSAGTSSASNTDSATTPDVIPGAPSGLTTTAISTTQISLGWTDNSDNETGFVVQRQTGTGSWMQLTTTAAGVTSYTDSTAAANTQYSYRVLATNSAGTSSASNSASATTPDVVPGAPSGLTTTASSATQITLAWTDNSNNETGFRIERQTGSGSWTLLTTTAAGVTNYSDTTVSASTQYSYRVSASNSVGASTVSNVSTVTTPAAPLPLAPLNTWGNHGVSSQNGKFTACVDAVPQASGADAIIGLSATAAGQYSDVAAIVRFNSTGFIDARNGGSYAAANTLAYTPGQSYHFRLVINVPNHTYDIYVTAQGGSEQVVGQGYAFRSEQNTVASLANFADYSTAGGVALGNFSTEAAPVTIPTAPSSLTTTAASTTQVNVAWTDNSTDETGFIIQRRTGASGTWTTLTTTAANATSYSDTTAAANTAYSYQVLAANSAGTSSATNISTVTTPAPVTIPTAPSSLTASLQGLNVQLAWTDNSNNETGFVIQRQTGASGTWTTLTTTAAGATSFTDSTAAVSTQYSYRVAATNSAGTSTNSAVASVTTGSTSGTLVTRDPNGWTLVTPASDAQIVYVSSSTGNDSNAGTIGSPVKTIAKAKSMFTSGHPVWLLLKAGDTFNESLGGWNYPGTSADTPSVIGSYGTGARPILATGTSTGITFVGASGPAASHVFIMGLDFYANGRDPSSPSFSSANADTTPNGVNYMRGGTDFLIENCRFRYYATNLVIQGYDALLTNFTLRRSVITDAYATTAHAQGIYMWNVNGWTIEDNVFDHNGWNASIPGAEPTIFNHNMYIDAQNPGGTVRNNIVANGAASGIMDRAGGIVSGNLVVNNPVSIIVGNSYNIATEATQVINNVILNGSDIQSNPIMVRGYGIEVNNTNLSTLVQGNIIANALSSGPAFALNFGNGGSNESASGNVVCNWGSNPIINNCGANVASGQVNPAGLVDTSRGVEAYMTSLGQTGSLAAFLAAARQQSQANWSIAYTAQAANTYIRQGYVTQAPSNVSATQVNATTANIVWGAVANASSYLVERSQDGGSTWVQVAAPAAGTTSFQDTSLSTGSRYSYRITAVNGIGSSVLSSTVNVLLT
jgi:hypothetical protein